MEEEDLTTALANLFQFRERWQGYSFLTFLEEHYFTEEKMRRWMYAHRQSIPYGRLVRMHLFYTYRRSMKQQFVEDCKQRREDRVIYALAREAESKFQSCILSNITVSSLTSPFADEEQYSMKLARSRAKEMEEAQGQSEKFMKKLDRFTIGVRPFENIPHNPYAPMVSYDTSADFREIDVDWHKVAVDSNKGTVTGCSCDFFFHYTRQCKHIRLVTLKHDVKFEVKPAFAKPSAGGVSISQRQPVMGQVASAPAPITPAIKAGLRGSNRALRLSPADSESEPSSPEACRPQHRSYNILRPFPVGPSSPPEPIAYDSSRVVLKRGLCALEQGPIKEEGPLPHSPLSPREAEPVRVPPAKIAFMKDTLSVIGKHTGDFSNGDQIRAALLLVNALLDVSTIVEGKKRRLE